MFQSQNFLAVIDGVTSKSDFIVNQKITGKLAAELIADVLSEAEPEVTLMQLLKDIERRYQKFYDKYEFSYDKRGYGLQAVAVIYSAYHRTIWLIGDCQAMVDGELYENPKKGDFG